VSSSAQPRAGDGERAWDYDLARRRLPNGLTLVTVRQPHLHRCALSLFGAAGSRFESAEDNGLSHFLEHMMFRGTARFPSSLDLNTAVERLGGSFAAATCPDTTEFAVELPRENLADGIELFVELVARPLFRELEIERKVIAEEIREDLDEHGTPIDIDLLSRRRLWPDHPLGQPVTGPLENVLRFDRDDVQRLFEERYVSGNEVVCLSGAFAPAVADRLAEELATLRVGPRLSDSPTPRPAPGPTAAHAHKPGSQTQVRLAFPAPGFLDPANPALELLLRVLDDGMSTRLHRRIFEERGLAYNVGADLESYPDAAAINIEALVAHDKATVVVEAILELMDELRDGPVTPDELEKARHRAIWSLESYQDSPGAMSGWFGEQELFRRPPTLEQEAAATAAVTAADIEQLARELFVGRNLHLTTVGVQGAPEQAALERLASSAR
jgi:predicted Zn-dependent peptidase